MVIICHLNKRNKEIRAELYLNYVGGQPITSIPYSCGNLEWIDAHTGQKWSGSAAHVLPQVCRFHHIPSGTKIMIDDEGKRLPLPSVP